MRVYLFSFVSLFLCGFWLSAQKARPNVVFILADDMGYGDLSLTGQTKYQTPNIDQLASEGMFFTNHYAGSTVCAPSRSALLTGLHTGHTPIRGNQETQPEGQYPLPDSLLTLPKLFQNAGYRTGAFGKWGLGFIGTTGDPKTQGIDQFYGYNCQKLAHRYYPDHLWSNDEKVLLRNTNTHSKVDYAPDLIHMEVLKFIQSQTESKPFFLFVPLIIPHAELAASDPELVKKYQLKFGVEKEYNAEEGGDYDANMNTGGYQSNAYPRATFAAMMEEMDNQVGEILNLLREQGLEENTIVIFTSDNGPHKEGGHDPEFFNSNSIYNGHKRDLYEGGIKIPLIVKWPNQIKPASTTEHISAFWDFLPTFSDILGSSIPQQTDGISMLPTLLGKGDQNSHDYLYWEFIEQGGKQAIRKGKWKAIRLNVQTNPNAPIELYKLENDPGESKNLASEYPEIINEMMAIFNEAHHPNPIFDLFK